MIVIMHQNVHDTARTNQTQLEAVYNMHFMRRDCIALHCLPFKLCFKESVGRAFLQSTEVRKARFGLLCRVRTSPEETLLVLN